MGAFSIPPALVVIKVEEEEEERAFEDEVYKKE